MSHSSSHHHASRQRRAQPRAVALALALSVAAAACGPTSPDGDPDAGVIVVGRVSAAAGEPAPGATVQVSGYASAECAERVTALVSTTADAAGRYRAEISALRTAFTGCVEVSAGPGPATIERRTSVLFREASPRDSVRVDVVLP